MNAVQQCREHTYKTGLIATDSTRVYTTHGWHRLSNSPVNRSGAKDCCADDGHGGSKDGDEAAGVERIAGLSDN